MKKKASKEPNYKELLNLECVPNAITLFNLVKETLKNNIDLSNNNINLININETTFIDNIKKIYNERLNVN